MPKGERFEFADGIEPKRDEPLMFTKQQPLKMCSGAY